MQASEDLVKAENTGVLISSGLIAGESLMAVILAFVVLGKSLKGAEASAIFHIADSSLLGMLVFLLVGFMLVKYPLQAAFKKNK